MANANSTSPRTSIKNASGGAVAENPHFDHIDRAPFELGRLLLELPRYASQVPVADKEGRRRAAAVVRHAENARNTLLAGLESLGACMFVAGTNDDHDLSNSHIADLGCLIRHISVEMQMLDGMIDEFGIARGHDRLSDAMGE